VIGLSATELLQLWDDGLAQTPPQRALTVLNAAWPEMSADELAELSIGQRDARLLQVRQGLWGPQMTGVLDCPACRERLELAFDTRELLARSPARSAGEMSFGIAGYSVTFRLPTSIDLTAAAEQADPEACRTVLFRRCLLSARSDGAAVEADCLPPDVLAGIAECMAEADPLADILFDVACPACPHRWRVAFDIVAFLWAEIAAWAVRMLTDVHTLARAYGWREHDVLSLGPARRQFYLEMVGV
jgi:hypothetical protein